MLDIWAMLVLSVVIWIVSCHKYERGLRLKFVSCSSLARARFEFLTKMNEHSKREKKNG